MKDLFWKLLVWWVNFMAVILFSNSICCQSSDYHFKVEKTGSGPAIIFIPGLTTDGAVWDETIEHLQGKYECHVLTLPGFAQQPKMDLEKGFLPVLRDELIEYLEEEKLEDVVIVGHSLGGFMALDLAAISSDRLKGLVIVDALPFMGLVMNPTATEESMKPIAENMNKGMASQSKEAYGANLRQIISSMITDTTKQAVAYEWGMQSDGPTAGQAMYELYTTDLRDELAEIELPTLVLGAWIAYKNFGATRASTLANYQMQYQNLKNVTIEMTDIGKHFIMWDDPTFFFAQLDAFLGNE